MGLSELLKWAEEEECYIEICGNGHTEIQFPPEYDSKYVVCADTLIEALHKARQKLEAKEVLRGLMVFAPDIDTRSTPTHLEWRQNDSRRKK